MALAAASSCSCGGEVKEDIISAIIDWLIDDHQLSIMDIHSAPPSLSSTTHLLSRQLIDTISKLHVELRMNQVLVMLWLVDEIEECDSDGQSD